MNEIRDFLNEVKEKTCTVELWDAACRIKLEHNCVDDKVWICVYPCGGMNFNDSRLCGNGAVFAYRAALRTAKRLHMVTSESKTKRFFHVRITTNKDVKRLAELWKYLTGKRFNKKILNNGWWEM